MAVKFLMSHSLGSLFVKGDVARFDDDVEKDLKDRKIAEAHAGKPAAAKQGA